MEDKRVEHFTRALKNAKLGKVIDQYKENYLVLCSPEEFQEISRNNKGLFGFSKEAEEYVKQKGYKYIGSKDGCFYIGEK